jgi:hypothetical protein
MRLLYHGGEAAMAVDTQADAGAIATLACWIRDHFAPEHCVYRDGETLGSGTNRGKSRPP